MSVTKSPSASPPPRRVLDHLWGRARSRYLQDGTLRQRLISGTFWSMVAQVLSNGLSLATTVLAARILGKSDFGRYSMVLSTVLMFAAFAGLGLSITSSKYVAQMRDTDQAATGRILALCSLVAITWGGLMTLGVLAASPYLARHTLVDASLTRPLAIASFLLVLGALDGSLKGALCGFEAFRQTAWIVFSTSILTLITIPVGLLLWDLTGGVIGAVAGSLAACVIDWIVVARVARRAGIVSDMRGCLREWPILWRFSLPAFLSGLVTAPVMWLCNVLLVRQPGGYAEMGLFAATRQWYLALLMVPSVMGAVTVPMLANLYAGSARRQYWKVLLASLKGTAIITSLAFGAIALLSPIIMRAYGSGFSNGRMVLIVMGAAGVLASIGSVVGTSMSSSDRMWWALVLNLLWAVAFVAAAYSWVHIGALGLAYAFLASYAFFAVLVILFVRFVIFENLNSQVK